jgi:glycerol-3-phosphate acyltransferase PlsY
MSFIIPIGAIIISYFFGCFSTARMIAKTFKHLNLYKIGTGHPDTENIYSNVSKMLGVLSAIIDISKSYLFLTLLKWLLTGFHMGEPFAHQNWLMLYGLFMLIGHCLPMTHKFRGGRGVLTYIGFIAYFAFTPMVIATGLAVIFIVFFKQLRFGQYSIVILPALFAQLLNVAVPYFKGTYQPGFILKLVGIAALMGVINLVVSKRLGEI